MSITSVIVLFSVIWFLTFLVILPLRQTTQADVGIITPGTPAGAPHIDTVGARVLGDGEPKIGAHGKPVLFLHPKDFNGCLIELERVSSITSVIVLFSVIWFLTFLVILPLRQTTQADVGIITPGTPAGAPHIDTVGAKAKLTTMVAIVIWGLLAAVLTSGVISISDFDWTKNLPPVSSN